MTDTSNPSAAILMLRLLARLTRKGARLDPDGDQYRLVFPGERQRTRLQRAVEPDRQIATHLVVQATQARWLEADELGRMRLTEAGALVLRRGLVMEAKSPAPLPLAPASRPEPQRATAVGTAIQRLRSKRGASGKAVLTSAQTEAAERLANDFLRGQMTPRVTANWDRAALGFAAERRGGAGPSDLSDAVSSAQERVRRALADAGAEFADLLVDVCCLDIGMEAVERQRGWPQRSAHVVLKLALDRLVRHYGIVASGPSHGKSRHWRDPAPHSMTRERHDGSGAKHVS